jgi:hypothetical protein
VSGGAAFKAVPFWFFGESMVIALSGPVSWLIAHKQTIEVVSSTAGFTLRFYSKVASP